ncbi:unnamed protein product [Toxocara canis]|uniref:Zinc transporter 8 n=1 Tax=Toxocara canis TaxID=6265 RepID=A0A183U957_TOXCA|nr:unnamed protein product [Toxocara canis]
MSNFFYTIENARFRSNQISRSFSIVTHQNVTCHLLASVHSLSNLNKQFFFSRAERSLYVATVLTVLFIIAEVFGGYVANSLAIMTDAGHMLSDMTSFVISIVAIKMAQMKPTKRLSYGFHRAEVLGALAR